MRLSPDARNVLRMTSLSSLESAMLNRPRMSATENLTTAAKRDLAKLQAGERVDLRYGPFRQLLDAGFIEGTQDNYRLVKR